jgi:hypothetical protein
MRADRAGEAMTERPIPFSAPMVRAILEGRKTMTRRIVKKAPDWMQSGRIGKETVIPELMEQAVNIWGNPDLCPYGKPGDRLYVKEAWRTGERLNQYSGKEIQKLHDEAGFRGTGHCCPLKYESDGSVRQWGDNDLGDFGEWGRYRHARFMPRWASRITLGITAVRVERLQEITEEDAKAEGVQPWEFNPNQTLTSGERAGDSPYRSGCAYLWDMINDHRATWKSNPFVWVISFRRVVTA